MASSFAALMLATNQRSASDAAHGIQAWPSNQELDYRGQRAWYTTVTIPQLRAGDLVTFHVPAQHVAAALPSGAETDLQWLQRRVREVTLCGAL